MKQKLMIKLLLLTVMPLVLLSLILMSTGYSSIHKTLIDQANKDMEKQCALVAHMYDRIYPGDYRLDVKGSSRYILYKGDYDITTEYDTLDSLKTAFGNDFDIFYGDSSVVTTLENEYGDRIVLRQISQFIVDDVINKKESSFYSDVSIEGKEFFAYFMPIINEDGECVGMYGVYQQADEIRGRVLDTMRPVIIIYMIATFIIAIVTIRYSSSLAVRIKHIHSFMNAISKGDFEKDIPAKSMKGKDELYDLARLSKKVQKSLRLLVECDELTSINNRRYGVKYIRKTIDRAKNSGTVFCVAIGDIDFFKHVNDTFGHDAGDEVLKAVANELRKGMLGSGFVARWGGEEFLLVFDMMNEMQAYEVLQEIQKNMRDLLVGYDDTMIKVTMSFGLAQGNVVDTPDDIIKKADERLYTAKEQGRDRIIWSRSK